MDESNVISDTRSTNKKTCIITNSNTAATTTTSNSSISRSSGGSSANNMETNSTNIPTTLKAAAEAEALKQKNGSSISSETVGSTATTTTSTSDQSNVPTKTSQEGARSSCTESTTPPGNVEVDGGVNNSCGGKGVVVASSKPDIDSKVKEDEEEGNISNINDPSTFTTTNNNVPPSTIDPLNKSTTTTTTTLKASSVVNVSPVSSSATGAVVTTTKSGATNAKVFCTETDTKKDLSRKNSDDNSSLTNSVATSNGNKPPVPNFRVEGSGAGDSSITVAVASLSSAVSTSVTIHTSGGGTARGGNSTGGTNSLENGEQPGSSSGPVSIQSSEEMRLSLVSWYSEPDDPSRIIEGCCSALNTYRQGEEEENGGTGAHHHHHHHRDTCGSGSSSMGHEAISSSVTNNSSPACKSESEEKENKTPEPFVSGGNGDKISGSKNDDMNGTHDTISSKSEFINPTSKKIDCDNNSSTNKNSNSSNAPSSQDGSSRKSQALLSKSVDGELGGKQSGKVGDSTKSAKTPPQKARAHVQVADHPKQSSSSCSSGGGGHSSRCQQDSSNRSSRPECPRCSRRSKSGTTTPASGSQVARTRTPANRRVVQSSKSSTEIKKPIKSILKHDSRGSAGSGSGSDKQSSMDSLGSTGDIGVTPVHILRGRMSNALMTRSDSGTRARFNFNSPSDTPHGAPEDKVVSKLKRIEKYATLRVRKSLKPRPLDLSDSEVQPGSNDVRHAINSSGSGTKGGVSCAPTDVMSKSMSYLEKSSSNRVHISSAQGHHHPHQFGESTSASSTLKRQGSLRVKKHGTPPQWEPSGTRTSALRLQKMQEAKAKNSPGGFVSSGGGGSGNSGSAHSGSGDSLHYLPQSANSTSTSAGSSGMSSIHLTGSHSAPAVRMSATVAAKEKHMGAKIFSKLSSAMGQTASSNQKRIKQERGVQTDVLSSVPPFDVSGRVSLSPVPASLQLEGSADPNLEQIKNLERLCTRYRNQFMKVQSEYERSESKKVDLLKQLEETQHESTEMIEFLQAEKSTLAESLTEVEIEAKKWKEEMEALKRDYHSRCSSLVRLSEQHKQEALKSQALLQRLESQSTNVISQISHQLVDGTQSIHQTTQRVSSLTESLLKTYKVPPELLASSETNQPIKETDLSCSLLLPLISSLSAAFPMVPMEISTTTPSTSATTACVTGATTISPVTTTEKATSQQPSASSCNKPISTSSMLTESSSFQSLNQAILEREAAEKTGLDDIMKPFSLFEGASPDADQLSLRKEITELNAAIAKLLNVVRVIVIHCDRKVSSVASSILQCLKSIEDDKVGSMAEIAQVQKSLEAWSEKGMSAGNSQSPVTTSSATNGSPPCKTTAATSTVCESPPTYLVGNGHAHV